MRLRRAFICRATARLTTCQLPLVSRIASSAPQVERAIPFSLRKAYVGCGRLCYGHETPTLIRYKIVSCPCRERPEHSKYPKGQVVFSQGDAGDAVFYIQKGKAKLTVVSEQGKEAVIAILGTDEFFGEGCLAGQAQRIATVTTMTDSVIARLEKSAIIRVIHQEPAFSELFIAHLLGRSIRVEADLVDQLFNSSEKRLARLLLLLANFGKEGQPEPVIAKISQETLAEMIGTTRSRVSFFMNKFRKLGFIDYNGGIEVHSSLLNVVLHDQPQIKN
jgi:CRP/FNR family transcriptional regulator, cyclic AMP receptor protein